MNDYESPFDLPGERKCTSPKDASRYPALHAVDGEAGHMRFPYTGRRCPVHNSGLKNETSDWRDWYRWREEFAKPEASDETREFALQYMLRYVNESNPPGIVRKTHHVKRQRPSDSKLVAISVISVILAVCMFTCFLAILL